ncbi:MAG: RAMP superfamily CRISPR-associated protein [Acidimicrobiales bacterium]
MTDYAIAVRIAMDEPWRVGTGTKGAAGIDDRTWSAADGSVVVPASHLKGKLREQAEWLAPLVGLRMCDGRLAGAVPGNWRTAPCQPDGALPCVGCRLFGSPRISPGWHFSPARLNLTWPEDRAHCQEALIVQRAQRRARTHNRVDPWLRRTSEDLLFTLEHAAADIELEATIGYLFPDQPPDDEVALLVAAIGALDGLGGRSRRGFGACRAWVTNAPGGRDHDQWVERLTGGRWAET